MCINKLSHGINQAAQNGCMKLIRLTCGCILITHLFFVDGLLILIEASVDQAHVINKVLDTFCFSFGEKLNKAKPKFSSLKMFKWTQSDR